VVAALYVALLVGMGISSIIVGWLLTDFSPLQLVRVVQGCALMTLVLNVIALWRQEKIRPMTKAEREEPRPKFRDAWADFAAGGPAGRLLAAVALGTFGFNMQDVLLEPYGGQILHLSVSSTTLLTALSSAGALIAFALAARWLADGRDPHRMAAKGVLTGIAAFSAVVFSAPMQAAPLFFAGAFGIGFGGGLFAVSTLTAAMTMPVEGLAGRGLALGAWGAAQATAAGLSVALGGGLRDVASHLAQSGALGPALNTPAAGYSFVYNIEIGLLFITLAALGPLVRTRIPETERTGAAKIGIAEFPT
jgi:BCD family chlorophyll transporter-like MFS transporter